MLSTDQRVGLQMAATYSPNLNRASLKGKAAIEQMADDCRVIAANAGSVDRDTLRHLGWLPAQLDRYGLDACDHARALSEVQRKASAATNKRVRASDAAVAANRGATA
jgi:hypothetical protein